MRGECRRALVRYSHEQLSPNATTVTSSNGQNSMLMDVGMVIPFGYKCIIGDYVNRRATDAKTHVLKIFAGWAEPVGAIIAAHHSRYCRAPYLRSPLE